MLARSTARPILRLCLGRWPSGDERDRFAAGFIDGAPVVAPILRGLHELPAAKEQVGRLAVLNLVREGRLPPPPLLGRHRVPAPGLVGNPLSYRTEKPIAFLHFEKTAGTALASILTEAFHPLQIDGDPQRAMAPHLRSPFVSAGASAARRANLIWGHYDLPSLRRADPTRAVFTLLREPRARLLSLYAYWRSVAPSLVDGCGGNFNVGAAHDNDLLGFLRSTDPLITDFLDNVYVRRLTGRYATGAPRDRLATDPDASLADALAALDGLDAVGVVERLDLSLPLLARTLDLALPATVPRRNGGENHAGRPALFKPTERLTVTAEVEAELDRLTRLDRVIYERASARLDRWLRASGEIGRTA